MKMIPRNNSFKKLNRLLDNQRRMGKKYKGFRVQTLYQTGPVLQMDTWIVMPISFSSAELCGHALWLHFSGHMLQLKTRSRPFVVQILPYSGASFHQEVIDNTTILMIAKQCPCPAPRLRHCQWETVFPTVFLMPPLLIKLGVPRVQELA